MIRKTTPRMRSRVHEGKVGCLVVGILFGTLLTDLKIQGVMEDVILSDDGVGFWDRQTTGQEPWF